MEVMTLCHDQEDLKIGIDDFSYKELDADHRSDLSSHGMDNERYLQIPWRIIRNPESWSLYCHFQYSDLSFYDSSADQAAEILQAEFCYAAGAYEDPEKISE